MEDTATNIVFPKDTQEGTQSFLAKWLKKIGDKVALHEPVAEVSTEQGNFRGVVSCFGSADGDPKKRKR